MNSRTIMVLLAGLAAAYQVVRTALVETSVALSPAAAARYWPGHPLVAMKSGMDDIGVASAQRRPVADSAITQVISASRRAPLATEPFLVRGVQAQLAGQQKVAAAAFATAKARDPRSIAARFFLAGHLFTVGDIDRGLDEATDLSRLIPGSREGMAPILADFARTPSGARRLKNALRDKPDLRTSLLTTLSSKPANADLVLFLAQGDELSADWRRQLVNSLVVAGDYRKAYAIWSQAAQRGTARPLLLDPGFKAVATATPPFGWALFSDANGLAETDEGGLHVIHYGRQNSVVAVQTLLLDPGRYRLAILMGEGAANPELLSWALSCLGNDKRLLTANLGQVAARKNAPIEFDVPPSCAAQRLELLGIAPEFPETADVSIAGLSLTRVAGR